MYEVTFSKKAIKVLKKFPKENQLRIKDGVDKLSIDPFKMDLEKIHTSDATHRLRIGAYRLFLQIDTSINNCINH